MYKRKVTFNSHPAMKMTLVVLCVISLSVGLIASLYLFTSGSKPLVYHHTASKTTILAYQVSVNASREIATQMPDVNTSRSAATKMSTLKGTGPTTIRVYLVSQSKNAIKVKDMIHYHIAYVSNGSSKLELSGGDFWYAVLRSAANPKASTAGRIVDHNNGTYSVYFYAGWAGQGTVSVSRVLNRKGVDFVNNTVWPAEDRVVWNGFFKSPGVKKDPTGICLLKRHGNFTGKCVYRNEKALGQTVFLCEKPDGVNCSTLYATKSKGHLISRRVKELARGNEALFTREKLHAVIKVDDATVNIRGPPDMANDSSLQCLADQELPVSHGYWLDGTWRSLICKITDWTEKTKLTSCLRGKNLLLFGDSTSRQWFVHILDLMGRSFKPTPNDLNFIWRRYFKDIDMSILISFPKQLVGSAKVRMREVFYEVDMIDDLNSTRCNYILMVSPWAHFSQWTRQSYIDRTQKLREALIRFRKRCPDVKLVLKGPHPRDHQNFDSQVYSNDFILHGIGEINRRLLGGIGVWFLPIWDMNLAHEAPNKIHMPNQIIHEEVKMSLSYVCGDSKVSPLRVR